MPKGQIKPLATVGNSQYRRDRLPTQPATHPPDPASQKTQGMVLESIVFNKFNR